MHHDHTYVPVKLDGCVHAFLDPDDFEVSVHEGLRLQWEQMGTQVGGVSPIFPSIYVND